MESSDNMTRRLHGVGTNILVLLLVWISMPDAFCIENAHQPKVILAQIRNVMHDNPKALRHYFAELRLLAPQAPIRYQVATEVISKSRNPGSHWLAMGILQTIPPTDISTFTISAVKNLAASGTPYVRLQSADWLRQNGYPVLAYQTYLAMAKDSRWEERVEEEAPILLSVTGSPTTLREIQRLKAHYVTRALGALIDYRTDEGDQVVKMVYEPSGMKKAVETYADLAPHWLTTRFLDKVQPFSTNNAKKSGL